MSQRPENARQALELLERTATRDALTAQRIRAERTMARTAERWPTPPNGSIIYPHVVETTHRGERTWDIFSRLLN